MRLGSRTRLAVASASRALDLALVGDAQAVLDGGDELVVGRACTVVDVEHAALDLLAHLGVDVAQVVGVLLEQLVGQIVGRLAPRRPPGPSDR